MRGLSGNTNHLPVTSSLCDFHQYLRNLTAFKRPRRDIWNLEFPAVLFAGEKFSITVELFLWCQHLPPFGRILAIPQEAASPRSQASFGICNSCHLVSLLWARNCAKPLHALFCIFPHNNSAMKLPSLLPFYRGNKTSFKTLKHILWISSDHKWQPRKFHFSK